VSSFDVQRSGMVCENSITLIVGIHKSRGIKQKSRVWPWETSDKCGGVVIQ
jgi:hypothetical protein